MLAVCQACQLFLPDIRGHHVLVRSDSRSVVSFINHLGGLVSKRLCTLANDLVWAQNWRTHVPGIMNQGADMLSRNNVPSEEQTLFFYKEYGCPGPRMAQPSAPCFPPSHSATAGTQASQGTTAQAYSNSTPLEEPNVGFGVIPTTESSPVADPLKTGLSLSSEWHNLASTARVMGPSCVAARREPFILLEHVLDTMAEVRALSTRRLYALKLSIFLAWCQDCDLDLVTANVSVVLSFLQEMLDKQRSSSTFKIHVAAITAFHAHIAGRSVGI